MNIIFCLPGHVFSGKFLMSWSKTLAWCYNNKINITISQHSSCNIYYARNLCLDGDYINGVAPIPFNGKIKYDYIMWIDSDIVFNPEQIEKLILRDSDIVSGLYLMDGGKQYATVVNWDEEYHKKNGTFKFLLPDEISNSELIPVSYTGMGFMLIKHGVFEKIEYPWFSPIQTNIGGVSDFTMEDVAFCLKAKEKGFTTYIDPEVIVGHEKKIVY